LEKFYKTFIEPLRYNYIIIGALIVIFQLLQAGFGEHSLNYFLLGAILFGIFIVLIITLIKTIIISFATEGSISGIALIFFYPLFALTFFGLSFIKFGKVFSAFIGFSIGFVILALSVDIRNLYLLGFKKIDFKNKRSEWWIKKIISIIFLIFTFSLIIGYSTVFHYSTEWMFYENSSTDITSLNEGELLAFSALYLPMLNFLLLIIISFIDIFRKSPLYIENMKTLNALRTYRTIRKTINYYKHHKPTQT
jgi:hypothetical protein